MIARPNIDTRMLAHPMGWPPMLCQARHGGMPRHNRPPSPLLESPSPHTRAIL